MREKDSKRKALIRTAVLGKNDHHYPAGSTHIALTDGDYDVLRCQFMQGTWNET